VSAASSAPLASSRQTSATACRAGDCRRRLRRFARRDKAVLLQRFFKTGPGEYGEGDRFLGVMVPQIRAVVKVCRDAPLEEIETLLHSAWHEERLLALLILVDQFERGDGRTRTAIDALYRRATRHINNWDLVDLTAPKIVGPYLQHRSRARLYRLAASRNMWERRIAMLATFPYIKSGDFTDALAIAARLLDDDEDLMHKAVGWMLREVGKKDLATLDAFLMRHLRRMPRTTLRYAIERHPDAQRRAWMRERARSASTAPGLH
jgi:3-methyladenine DNA glycosylase AlkD